MSEPVRLAVWSGPRNISTALMRSWENREDAVVVDEPLYAHYLAVTGLDHPGRDGIIRAGEPDWRLAVQQLLAPQPAWVRVYYQKHMVHHLIDDIERGWIRQLDNVLLIRDPREVLASYVRSRPNVVADDIGLPQQVRLYDELTEIGPPPPVIDSADFLRDPESYLRAICLRYALPFTTRMLSWPPGPRGTDGVWAPHWYAAVQASTGFEPYRTRDVRLEGRAVTVAAECLPLYERLHGVRWTL